MQQPRGRRSHMKRKASTSYDRGELTAFGPSSFRKFNSLFSETDRKRLVRLFLAIILIAFLQVAGIAAVLPFLDLAANPDRLAEGNWLSPAYTAMGLTDPRTALVIAGVVVVLLLAGSNAASAYLVWQRQRIAWSVAHHLSLRLVKSYIALPFAFFLRNSSADLIKKNINDVNNIVNGVLLEGSNLATYLLTSGMILTLLMLVEPVATLLAGGLLLCMFGAVAVARRRYLSRLGRETLQMNQRRFETFVDIVGGIKTIKTDGAWPFFTDRFAVASHAFSLLNPKVQSAAVMPRFVVEVVTLGGIVLATTYLVSSGASMNDAMPSLTLFAVAAYRLIPALAGAYSAYVKVVSSYPAVDSIYEDLQNPDLRVPVPPQPIRFNKCIEIEKLSFRYDLVNPLVLDDVTLKIAKGEKVGFVGPSGSGKSTLIDIIMGLFSPISGRVLIDGVVLDASTKENWRARIGYVPQSVFLYDDTIARNIAFGQDPVDVDRLREACDWAQLSGFVASQADGFDTLLGERGVRLSGGECQRIGLARAFYRQPEVLVLDEATSALDSQTEEAVIRSIERYLPHTTALMIAHRISTVQHCDRLFVMSRGKVHAEGSFAQLMGTNKLFRDLARIS